MDRDSSAEMPEPAITIVCGSGGLSARFTQWLNEGGWQVAVVDPERLLAGRLPVADAACVVVCDTAFVATDAPRIRALSGLGAPVVALACDQDLARATCDFAGTDIRILSVDIEKRRFLEAISAAIQRQGKRSIGAPTAPGGIGLEEGPLPAHEDSLAVLSDREREVLHHLLAGLSNKAVARELGLSAKTISTHKQHILEKLGAASIVELIQHWNRDAGDAGAGG